MQNELLEGGTVKTTINKLCVVHSSKETRYMGKHFKDFAMIMRLPIIQSLFEFFCVYACVLCVCAYVLCACVCMCARVYYVRARVLMCARAY